MKIKEKVLKEVLFNVKFSPVLEPKQFSKLKGVIDQTLAEVNKVIDENSICGELIVNQKELKQKLGGEDE